MPCISPTASDSDILTRAEVAKMLRLSIAGVEGLIRRGELRTFKVGTHIRIRREALEAFIANAEAA